ncbi:hypothetical protein BZA05DRAFT_414595 [Tricharina praecox]|uniref:uncharacterized protein n=1 Tax=Tricharina praecox TaxID=43433 RepID=UPI00221FA27D|nr:uncharacterized protein BZA05DRAFT_414595 [Tricharina praecox]KAI5858841.1 hypothetical protein BZA05DRAFT_414595 [Tricharina praecox]
MIATRRPLIVLVLVLPTAGIFVPLQRTQSPVPHHLLLGDHLLGVPPELDFGGMGRLKSIVRFESGCGVVGWEWGELRDWGKFGKDDDGDAGGYGPKDSREEGGGSDKTSVDSSQLENGC